MQESIPQDQIIGLEFVNRVSARSMTGLVTRMAVSPSRTVRSRIWTIVPLPEVGAAPTSGARGAVSHRANS
jgi:hypothetical protein